MSDSVTPWTVTCQAPLSLGFSRQEYWNLAEYLLAGPAEEENVLISSFLQPLTGGQGQNASLIIRADLGGGGQVFLRQAIMFAYSH